LVFAIDPITTLYPVESPTIYGGDEEKNVHSLLRVGFKAPAFLTGFTNGVIEKKGGTYLFILYRNKGWV